MELAKKPLRFEKLPFWGRNFNFLFFFSASQYNYSRLQFDGSFLKKRSSDFVFSCGTRHHRHAPRPVAL